MGDKWKQAESKAYDVLFWLWGLCLILTWLVACGGCVWLMALATFWAKGGSS